MPFIDNILKYKSLSLIGLEKNTGKTVCLNYILSRLKDKNKNIALTSIGVDGETKDIIKETHKPEINIYEGVIFINSEMHYRAKQIVSEILDVSKQATSLGRLVTARALSEDKIMLSGPASSKGLIDVIEQMQSYNVDLTIIDGALSRKSLGSPAVSEAVILSTGAAVSANINSLVSKTLYVFTLINLPKINDKLADKLININEGIWAIDNNDELINTHIRSVLFIKKEKEKLFKYGTKIYVSGALTDSFMTFLCMQKNISETEIIIRDFTRVFALSENFYRYIKKGGKISVVQKTKLIAVCVNPTSPGGINLDSLELRNALENKLGVPIYDVKKL